LLQHFATTNAFIQEGLDSKDGGVFVHWCVSRFQPFPFRSPLCSPCPACSTGSPCCFLPIWLGMQMCAGTNPPASAKEILYNINKSLEATRTRRINPACFAMIECSHLQ
jgi:hypothetical protein